MVPRARAGVVLSPAVGRRPRVRLPEQCPELRELARAQFLAALIWSRSHRCAAAAATGGRVDGRLIRPRPTTGGLAPAARRAVRTVLPVVGPWLIRPSPTELVLAESSASSEVAVTASLAPVVEDLLS